MKTKINFCVIGIKIKHIISSCFLKLWTFWDSRLIFCIDWLNYSLNISSYIFSECRYKPLKNNVTDDWEKLKSAIKFKPLVLFSLFSIKCSTFLKTFKFTFHRDKTLWHSTDIAKLGSKLIRFILKRYRYTF